MTGIYRFGNCELRPGARTLLVSGRAKSLPGRTFDVLVALVERKGRPVSKAELLDIVWPRMDVGEGNVEVHVFAIREAIGRDAIVTIPRHGYRFEAPVDALGETPLAGCARREAGPPGLPPEQLTQDLRETSDQGLACPHALQHGRLTVLFERAALEGRPEDAAWAGEALARIDVSRNVYTTMAHRQQLAFELLPLARTDETRARLWTCIAFSRHTAFSPAPKLEAGKAEVAAWRRVGEPTYLYEALSRYAAACGSAGRPGEAARAIAQARKIERSDWPASRRLVLAFADSTVAAFGPDPARFLVRVAAQDQLARQAGSCRFVGNARLYRAEALLNLGRSRDALALAEEAMYELAGWEHCLGYAVATAVRCQALLSMSLEEEAAAFAWSALPHAAANGCAGWLYDVLAAASARRGRHRQSASLLGYADGAYRALREVRRIQDRRCASEAHARNRDALGSLHASWVRHARAASHDARTRAIAGGELA